MTIRIGFCIVATSLALISLSGGCASRPSSNQSAAMPSSTYPGPLMVRIAFSSEGDVGGIQYSPFRLDSVRVAISTNIEVVIATMANTDFNVVGLKHVSVHNAITLIHQALDGLYALDTDTRRAIFMRQLVDLCAKHTNDLRSVAVTVDKSGLFAVSAEGALSVGALPDTPHSR